MLSPERYISTDKQIGSPILNLLYYFQECLRKSYLLKSFSLSFDECCSIALLLKAFHLA